MDVFEAIRTVLAVRGYREQRASREVVTRVLEAGRLTASAKNAQPWHFIAIQERKAILDLTGMSPSGRYMGQAAFVIAVAVERASQFGISDASRAIQDMILAGWAEGLGSNWVGFAGQEKVREYLGVPPEYDVVALLPFGYPEGSVGLGRKARKPLGEVASSERFGRPFEG